MFLERVKILNFRGIRRLKVDFNEDCSVLIGENHWGKTSLLRALWMILGNGERLCQFEKNDLYVPVQISTEASFPNESLIEKVCGRRPVCFDEEDVKEYKEQSRGSLIKELRQKLLKDIPEDDTSDEYLPASGHIRIDLFFCESALSGDLELSNDLKSFWYYCDDGNYRIHYRLTASVNEKTGEFETVHELVKPNNKKPKASQVSMRNAILSLIRLNPVLRLRDSRMEVTRPEDPARKNSVHSLLSLMTSDGALSGAEAASLAAAFEGFFDKYLSNYARSELSEGAIKSGRNISDIINAPISLESLSSIRSTLSKPGFNRSKVLATYLSALLMLALGSRELSEKSRPILIFEDIESRFHPSMLLSLWSLISTSGAQKIVTTNSGDLLSAVSLTSVRRLYRKKYDTICYKVNKGDFTAEDMRHIAFHVRLNRPMTLFARTWIFVEGETEVWILTQIASILGISLPCEGVRIIEFAQCGLKSLLKLAVSLGINFHVLTDGDEAGRKYADTVRTFLHGTELDLHMTTLPNRDIEHYLYSQGYADVFIKAAGSLNVSNLKKSQQIEKIIYQAIKRKSKPGLALLLVEEIQRRGVKSVPLAFASLLENVRTLSNERP